MSLELGNQIKKFRTDAEMTQNDLADKLNVSRQTISKWELERSYPDIESLITLSKVFGVTVDSLLGLTDKNDSPRSNNDKAEKKRVTRLLKGYIMKTRDEKVKVMMDQISAAYSDPEVKKHPNVMKFLFDEAKDLDKNENYDVVASRLCKEISLYSFEHPKEPLKGLNTLYYQVKGYATKYDGIAIAAMMLPVWGGQ
ncbi:helix-turn-helix domain-containing protein [Companilactobacillus insicii]|uniref:helix-turn-helix domain-containing protein n=1 Tax=Companilactobacillus insicii TaxID=1732567 RepID=UPI000F78E801|nr:helix-turn-helix domain-containing protein [Companilactobacillus insicii]